MSGRLEMASGTEEINGVELCFPHSTTGAVSAPANDAGAAFSLLAPPAVRKLAPI